MTSQHCLSSSIKGKTIAKGVLAAVIIVAIILVVVVFVIILQDGQRRIAVQYSQESTGQKNVRRPVHTYSAEGQHSRSYPGYFCVIPDADAGHYRQLPWKRKRYRNWKSDPERHEFQQLV